MNSLDLKNMDFEVLLNLQNKIQDELKKKLINNVPTAFKKLSDLRKECNDLEEKIDTLKRTIYKLLSEPLEDKFKADFSINDDGIISIYSLNEYGTKIIEIDLLMLKIKEFKGFSENEAKEIFECISGVLKNV